MNTATIDTIDADLADFLGLGAPPATTITAVPAPAPAATDPLAFLSGISEDKPKSKRKAYPDLPDPEGVAANLGVRTIELSDAADQLKTNNKLLGELFLPHYFRYAHGRAEPESGMRLATKAGSVLCVATSKLLKMTSEKALDSVRAIFGGVERDMFFWTFDLSVDSDNIPLSNQAAFVAELKTLCANHGAKLEVKKEFKPRASFFTERHLRFNPDQNMEINRALPQVTSIKSKGVA